MRKLFRKESSDSSAAYSLERGAAALEGDEPFHSLASLEHDAAKELDMPRAHAVAVRQQRRGPVDPRLAKPPPRGERPASTTPTPASIVISKDVGKPGAARILSSGAREESVASPSRDRPVEVPGNAASQVERMAADFDEGVLEFARHLGIDCEREPHLLHIAEEAYFAPLPSPWVEVEDEDGRIYYYNEETDVSAWEHPLDKHYRSHIFRMKEEAAAAKQRALRPRAASVSEPALTARSSSSSVSAASAPTAIDTRRTAASNAAASASSSSARVAPEAQAQALGKGPPSWRERTAASTARSGDSSPLPADTDDGWELAVPGAAGEGNRPRSPCPAVGLESLTIDPRAKGRNLDTTRAGMLPPLPRKPSVLSSASSLASSGPR